MTFNFCKRSTALPLLLCSLSIAPLALHAQNDGVNGPPNVLLIQREFLKPGKGGMLHEATEGAFIRELDAKNAPIHYFALNSMTGPDRALFFSGYVSFAAMEAEHKEVAKITGLGAALDRANVADGDLLAGAAAACAFAVASVAARADDIGGENGNPPFLHMRLRSQFGDGQGFADARRTD